MFSKMGTGILGLPVFQFAICIIFKKCFWKKSHILTKAAFIDSKNSNIVKYYGITI